MSNRTFCLALCALLLVLSFSAQAQEAQQRHADPSPAAIYKELNGIDRSLHREIRQTAGIKPVTTPLEQLLAKYDLSPRKHACPVYFGQPNVQPTFGDTGIFPNVGVDEIFAKLKAGYLSQGDIPIQFIWVNGNRVTVNNRSLTALYKAGMRPSRLVDRTDVPDSNSDARKRVLARLESMAGKPSTEMLVRASGLGRDGRFKEASGWDAPIGEIVSMPGDVLMEARTCKQGNE
jgi:hypothetical protein